MTRRALPSVLAALAIAIGAVALLAPNHGQAIDPVAQAADATVNAGTAEFGLAGKVTAAGQTIPLSGNGVMDMRGLRGRMTINTQVPGAGQVSIEELIDGTTFYVKVPQMARVAGGKQWMKLDLAALGKAEGVDLSGALQGGQNNPADMLGALKGVGASRKVGEEAIGGALTTHYHADIDLQKAVEAVGDAKTAGALKQVYEQSGIKTMPVDVWIDRSGRVRREQLAMSFGSGAEQAGVDMTIDFTRFGVPLDVTPPPADQVLDGNAFLGALGGKSG